MFAAVLPLPPQSSPEILERGRGIGHFDPKGKLPFGPGPLDESQYHSARWWRQVNRFMSILGLLIIGAVVALVVIGIRQGWVQSSSRQT